jgi:hypothetical protein
MNALGNGRFPGPANLILRFEDFLFAWKIGKCGFQTCYEKRKSSFVVADWKSELEDFLFSSQVGKNGFPTCQEKRKSFFVVADWKSELEDFLFCLQVGKDGFQTFARATV